MLRVIGEAKLSKVELKHTQIQNTFGLNWSPPSSSLAGSTCFLGRADACRPKTAQRCEGTICTKKNNLEKTAANHHSRDGWRAPIPAATTEYARDGGGRSRSEESDPQPIPPRLSETLTELTAINAGGGGRGQYPGTLIQHNPAGSVEPAVPPPAAGFISLMPGRLARATKCGRCAIRNLADRPSRRDRG